VKLATVSYLVRDYDEAIAWFREKLGFEVKADTPLGEGKRWVVVAAKEGGARLLLAKAEGKEQKAQIGKAAGGRVAFFLETPDFAKMHEAMSRAGVRFLAPRHEAYGTVAVFADLYGNKWDLIQPAG
jgi:catechol 2,3-dioxygenase-like lactoylglutathione lyase family enzyme